ncbi:PilC/PilY family type IV pilus protein [Snodgrassella communis]|uniref:PilC/PilY family type IV pilus protein n=1 Tax=Snodgrassella communis TaxID=2946699 RepID=UPI00286B7D66|nr:PilC/PilY family type IV pilus protein [Snodgrassella communis]WMY92044.1 PilC/PilY family type IV pilus protein [Snodgrassella communis]
MSIANIKPKKSKIMQKGNFLFLAVSNALAVVSSPQAGAATNDFAEVPLHLQGKVTTTKAYSVKPNVTLYIDDSGSMSDAVAQRCPIVHVYTCRRLNPFNNRCAAWGPVSVYNKDVVIKQGAPLVVTEDDPSQPVEKHTVTYYLGCRVDYTRMDAVKRALNSVVDKYRNKFYFALQPMDKWLRTENNPNGIGVRYINYNKFYDTSKPEEYQQLKDYINGNASKGISPLEPGGGTPTHQRLNAVVRNTVFNKLRYRCQKSYLILFSDGEAADVWPYDDRTRWSNLDYNYERWGYFDGYFDENKEPREVLSVPLTKKLQYYTDILRTKSFGPYIYSKAFIWGDGYALRYATEDDGVTYYYENRRSPKRADLRRTVDEAGQPWDSQIPDSNSGERFTQTVTTYTIGSGLGRLQYAIDYLRNGASPRPERDPTKQDPDRYFFKADDADEILDAFENIFKEMGGETTEETIITTAKTPKIGVSSSSNTASRSIMATVNTGTWSSQICINKPGATAEDIAACKVQPSFSNRKLVLNDGGTSYLYSGSMQDFSNDYFKIPDNEKKNATEWRDGLLNWLNRSIDESQNKPQDFVLDYRKRKDESARNMGEILDNDIETIGDDVYGLQKFLITSTNEGMVYVFQAADNESHPYDLKFNYMPMQMDRDGSDDLVRYHYQSLVANEYGKNDAHPHEYLLNGGFVVVGTPTLPNKPKQYFMVSNMGQGGRGAFAINIGGQDIVTGRNIAADNMSSNTWYKDLFLFQTPSGLANEFGYTLGKPGVGIVRINKDPQASTTSITDHLREVAMINNGYNYPGKEVSDNESALYFYDILGVDIGTNSYQKTGYNKGELIKKLIADTNGGGLSGPVGYDINNDGVTDIIYAGDYGGNLYRFDMRNPDPDQWTVRKIFTAQGPITITPTLFKPNPEDPRADHKIIIVFGTGSDIYQSDKDKKDQQAIYGIYDDYDQPANTVITHDQLLKQTMSYNGDNGTLSNSKFEPTRHKGWYFTLNTDGERVVTRIASLLTTGVAVTRAYGVKLSGDLLDDPCRETTTSEETKVLSRLTQFNVRTGGALTRNEPRVVTGDGDSSSSSVGIMGMYALRIVIDENGMYNGLDTLVSGNQELGDHKKQDKDMCFRKPPEVHGDGKSTVENAPMCPISFKQLSWRQVKTSYNQ